MSTPGFSIIAGPARITFHGQTLFSTGDVVVTTRVRAFEVAAGGRPAQRREDQVDVALTFTPDGNWPPMCALLQALGSVAVGRDLFGAAAVVIDSMDGWTYSYANAALTTPPTVVFSAGRTLFGPATITALGADGRRVTITRPGYPVTGDGYDPAGRVAQPYTLSWGSSAAWANLTVPDGITLAFDLSLTPRRLDGPGLIGWRLDALQVTARARPLGIADADVLAAWRIQGAGAGRGRLLGGRGAPDLVVAGAGIYARLYAAGLDAGQSQFGAALNRVGELGWTASVAGRGADRAPGALFFLGTSAPE